MSTKFQQPDSNWVHVELFRHQYGNLPGAGDMRKIDFLEATQKMAQAVDEGEVSTFNAAMVIAYLGRRLGGEG